MTCQNRKKYTIIESGKILSTSSTDQFNPSTRQRITILADKVSCHYCIQLCASRLHLQSEGSSFERLSTPRPAPKIVLESAWQSQQQQQQQQQDTSESGSSGTRKLVQRVEKVEREREERGNPTDDPELPSARKLKRSTESLVEKRRA